MRRLLALLISFSLLVPAGAYSDLHEAALKPKPKKSPTKVVLPSDVFKVVANIKIGKKKKKVPVMCLKSVPGNTKKSKGKLLFTPLSYKLKQMTEGHASSSQISELKLVIKAAKKLCKTGSTGGSEAHLSLEPYTGAFGEEEARILFDRFAFGGSPEDISRAVQEGLTATVNRLMTYAAEPYLDGVEADLRCDGHLSTDPENENCDPTNPNDLYAEGFRYAIYYRMLYTQHPFFEKMFMFLHDERLAASSSALSGCEMYALPVHVEMIRQAVRSGDYVQYMRNWNNDLLGHLEWLDGESNHGGPGQRPNENYAREFWELGTVGASGLTGAPNYTDVDIAQSALAFTGWDITYEEINNHYVCVAGKVPYFHTPGMKTIFNGTPQQTRVDTDEDVLKATFENPHTAESLARDLWKEFINPFATPQSLQAMAQGIREANYNLLPTIRRMMLSRAMFADKSRKSLIKHPIDILVGFLRTTKIPVTYREMEWLLRDLGQVPLQPPTVFGWDERRLSGESFVLEWRNTANWLISRGDEDFEERGFSYDQRFLTGLPGQLSPSMETINRVSNQLGISLTDSQKAKLDDYMNFDLRTYGCPGQCNGQPYRLDRNAFDTYPGEGGYKLRGLLLILSTLPQYRMK